MAQDMYIEILSILNKSNGSLTNEELAHEIVDMVRNTVDRQFMNLLKEFRESCNCNK